MLRSARLPCCGSTRPSSFFSHRAPTLQRQMSTRQAERLRRSPAAEAKRRAEMAGGSAQPKAPGSTKRLSSGAARSSEARRTTSSTAKPAAAAPAATSAGTSKPPMRGRFNRLVVERGFFFTVYLYVLGESITLSLAYALHTHRLGVGDTGSWLATLHFPVDRFLNVGPAVYGLQLSPRLLLNYVAANLCTYPLLPLQLRFCAATAPVLQVPFAWIVRLARRPVVAVPKAPAAQP